MKILIVAATLFEIKPLLSHLGVGEVLKEGGVTRHKKGNMEIDFLVAGVGMVSTAYQMGKAVDAAYDLAINAGICGSFNNNLDIGAVVNVVEDCFSELGAEDGDAFLTLEDMKLPGIVKIYNDKAVLKNNVLELLPKVNGITVNTVHGNEASIDVAVNRFHPIVESMEGAAFMMVCQEQQIEYAQVRAVSNYVERRNRENWNIPLAINNLSQKMIELMDSLEVQNGDK